MNETSPESPLEQMAPEQRGGLINSLNENEKLLSASTRHDFYQLLLVLCGSRPACCISTVRYATTPEAAEVCATIPPQYWEHKIEPFLTESGIPFVFNPAVAKVEEGKIQVSANYFVSFDSERRDDLRNHLSDRSPWDSLTREEDVAIGRFLDYPESIIQEWCENSRADNSLFDNLSDDEVLEQMGDQREIFRDHNLDPAGFVQFLLPYVVPASASDSKGRVFEDARSFLRDGRSVSDKYKLRTFSDFVDHYKEAMVAEYIEKHPKEVLKILREFTQE